MVTELLLKHTDNLSKTFQHVFMSAAEGQQVASMTVATMISIRSDEHFNNFWHLVLHKAEERGISEPQLPRQRKLPRRYDDEDISEGIYFPSAPMEHFRKIYYEAFDSIVTCIQDRFDQLGYRICQSFESLLLKACKKEETEVILETVCKFYGDYFDTEALRCQMHTFGIHFHDSLEKSAQGISIFDIKKYFIPLSPAQSSLLDQVRWLFELIMVMPATNATSERSFSALRCLKNYLRTTMSQQWLNHLMILHIHNERTDNLDLKQLHCWLRT